MSTCVVGMAVTCISNSPQALGRCEHPRQESRHLVLGHLWELVLAGTAVCIQAGSWGQGPAPGSRYRPGAASPSAQGLWLAPSHSPVKIANGAIHHLHGIPV